MLHGQLTFEDIRVGNKGACLDYNLLEVCTDPKCSYRHAQAKPTAERIRSVATILKPAVEAYIASGGAPRWSIQAKTCSNLLTLSKLAPDVSLNNSIIVPR